MSPTGTGVFGGTFDPIHLAHLAIAEAARQAADLERVLFVPAAMPPHKAGLAITAVVATSVCLVATYWAWTPEPPIFATVRAHQAAVTASAEAVLASHARGTCSPATSIDLGPLADHGPWSTVCVYGTVDGSIRGLQVIRPAGSSAPGLLYSATGDGPGGTPTTSSGCVRRITGNWWADRSPTSDFSNPCPRQYIRMSNN